MLHKIVEEFLYPAKEDFAVDVIFDRGMNARSYRSRLEHFTLVGRHDQGGFALSTAARALRHFEGNGVLPG